MRPLHGTHADFMRDFGPGGAYSLDMKQAPDTAPGPYYVSVIRPEKPSDPRLLAGPYALHAAALADVAKATDIATDLDPKASFYAFGTIRMRSGYDTPGILNKLGKM